MSADLSKIQAEQRLATLKELIESIGLNIGLEAITQKAKDYLELCAQFHDKAAENLTAADIQSVYKADLQTMDIEQIQEVRNLLTEAFYTNYGNYVATMDFNGGFFDGQQPLQLITSLGSISLITHQILQAIDKGTPNFVKGKEEDDDGFYPLHQAVTGGFSVLTKKLLEKESINVNFVNQDGITPLIELVKSDPIDIDVFNMLLGKGADLTIKSENGCTVLSYARKYKVEGWAEAVQKKLNEQLVLAINEEENDRILALLDAGAQIHVIEIDALNANIKAVIVKHKNELNEKLFSIAKGHNYSAISKIYGGATEEQVIQLLIAAGADISATDKQGLTPLHHAAAAGEVDVVSALIAAGAYINVKDNKGEVPYELFSFNLAAESYDTALEENKKLTNVYKAFLGNPQEDPIVIQMTKLQSEMETAKNDKAVQPAVLAQTLNAVNKELKNHMDYRFGAKEGPFQPAHKSGELNDLIQKSKDATSPYKKVAGYALMGIGLILGAGFLVGLGFVTFGVAPAILTPVIAAIAPIVSFKIAVAVGLTASASIGGSVALNRAAREDARKDAKVLDTAGEAVKVIRTESVKQNIEGATDFFKPKKGLFASMLPEVTPIPSK